MKTLQDLYNEIMDNDAEKKAFVEAMKADAIEDFLRQHDCDATAEEIGEFLESKAAEDSPLELSMDELAEVAGGTESALTFKCTETKADSCGCSNTCIKKCC